MESSKLNKIINIIREDMTATGGGLAGLPPEEPPVDLRKTKYKKIPYFFRELLKKNKKRR
jgi:hypothetical protein